MSDYRFSLEHLTRDGRRLGESLVTPDFGPAREWAYFAAVRRRALPLVTAPAEGAVVPVWSDEFGPHVSGFRVLESEFPSEYFLELAQKKAVEYVERGEAARGEAYRYRVCAHPAEPESSTSPVADFGVEALPEPIALGERSQGELRAHAEPVGEIDALDAPVFVAAEVIAEICELAQRAGELETGGVLVGRLQRDPLAADLFVEVVAQIPARHAEARGTSFAFTPETWAAADAALALRGGHELISGWWHSHPNFCRDCPEERRRTCSFARPFFSAEDVHLHRTCFPQAWQLALLVSDLPERGPTPALFGWRMGRVVERGFSRLRCAEREES